MRIVTVFVPEKYIEYLETFVDEGRYPNRSEAIRVAIRDLIMSEFRLRMVADGDDSKSERAQA
ncbi:MAG: hypothetical protein Kow0069_34340 [Promethearchaeota archaeon]